MKQLFAAVLASLAVLGCPSVASSQPLKPVTMGLGSGSLVAASARIAAELGLFQAEGLAPRFVVLDSANAATTALIARSVDAAVSGPAEVVIAQTRGRKVVVVANAYGGLGASLVLAKPVADRLGLTADAPVAARLKAIDGLTIGAPSATATYKIAFETAAKDAGATPRFTYMGQAAMPAALESGAIQGFVASAPVWSVPVVKGTGLLWISGPKGELPARHAPASSANVQMLREAAEADPALARGIAAVFAGLARAVDQRPDDVKAAVAKLYPDVDRANLNLMFPVESLAWKARPLTPDDMRREIAFVKTGGATLPGVDELDPAALLFP